MDEKKEDGQELNRPEEKEKTDTPEEKKPAEAKKQTKKPAKAQKKEPKPEKKQQKKPKEPKQGGEKKKKNPWLRRILAGILTLLLIALAVLVFIFRDRLSNENLPETLGQKSPLTTGTEAYTYESGSDQVFAAVGDGLAVASGSALQLLDADGETVWKQIVSYGAPAVFGGEKQALFCDIGGTAAVVVGLDGESRAMETSDEIITAAMNESGWFTIVTEAAGYKGLVRVYNADCELQYEWWSGSGYVLRAAVSPDHKLLAALCADGEGGKLHLFSLSSETELASAEFPQELAFDLCFLGSDTVCCISETALHFLNTKGEEKGKYELGDSYLMDYDFGGDGFVSLFVSAYRTGTGGLLMTLDRTGTLQGYVEVSSNVTSLCAGGKQLLVMTGGDLTLYGQDMAQENRTEALMTAKRAILQPNGDILLLYAYTAERYRF